MKLDFWLGREFRRLVLMCGLVLACAWASSRLSSDAGGASCIWIANAITSAFALTASPRRKFLFVISGLCATAAIDMITGTPLGEACWFAVSNVSEVLITVLTLGHIAVRADMSSQRALCRIAYFGVFLAPLLGALLGAPAVAIIEHRPWLEVLRLWFLSESLGMAAAFPLILFVSTAGFVSTTGFVSTGEKRRPVRAGTRVYDAVAWAGPLVAVTAAVFWQTKYPVVFLLFPPLIAVLFRFRLAGAIYGSSLVLILAAAFTAEGHGPFRLLRGDAPMEQVMLFHIFGLTLFATGVPVGFLIEERYRFDQALKSANGKLTELAFRDGLTGLLNRRSFDEILESTWPKAMAARSDLSLLYLDIDFFKRFNDSYGHQSGDDCLRSVSTALVECVRESGDCVARYGGEEFVIVLSETSGEPALAVAERIASAIRGLQIPHHGSPFGFVTASFGVATISPSAGSKPSELVQMADDALYRAKRGGRNCVEAASNAICECVA